MQTITAYRAADGTIFDNKEACERHDQKKVWQDKLVKFVDANGISRAQLGILGKYIPLWEAFKEKSK